MFAACEQLGEHVHVWSDFTSRQQQVLKQSPISCGRPHKSQYVDIKMTSAT